MITRKTSVKNIIIGGLQEFFSVPNNIDVTGYEWNRDIRKTKMVIADNYPGVHEILNGRPSIIFQKGGVAPIPNIQHHWHWDEVFQNFYYVILNQGIAALGCLCREGLDAENLAETVKGILECYDTVFITMGLHRLDNVSIGNETPITLAPNNQMVMFPVTFDYVTTDSWKRQDYSRHPLEQIDGRDVETDEIILSIN